MRSLRTPKTVTGPDLGVASLSVRAWWEASFGASSWTSLDKIPRDRWQTYLAWVRRMTGIKVTNDAEVIDIEPLQGGLLAIHARVADDMKTFVCRKLVLATGIEGSGRWSVPDVVERSLPRHCYAHTAEPIDFESLRGKAVAVLGAGASAFDNAAMALEHGAASVDLLARRARLPSVNPNRWMEFAGFMRHFAELDDARKWRFMKHIFDMNQPPPQETFDRCARHQNFTVHLGCDLNQTEFADGRIRLATSTMSMRAEFLIVGTGFAIDLAARPELGRFHDKIALWSDRYRPPDGEAHAQLGSYPYLSPNFQFTEKAEGTAPFLTNIFSYTFAAMPSLGSSAGISVLKYGVERIVAGIGRALFLEDADSHFDSLRAYDEQELDISRLQRANADTAGHRAMSASPETEDAQRNG
jgi:cation diffusion facilitator CzcD-associated flavoprotein CzcO